MTSLPPQKGVAFTFYVALTDSSNRPDFKASPTLATGDFKVSIGGGTLANLATLPTNEPAGSVMVKIPLSTSEMNGSNITVVCIDAAGAEWDDLIIDIQTSNRTIDDLAFPTTTGRSLTVDTAGGVDIYSISGDSTAADRLELLYDGCRSGTAQTGAAASITLDASAVATDDYYNGMVCLVTGGTGAGQGGHIITDYVGSTLIATVSPPWATTPDNTSTFLLVPLVNPWAVTPRTLTQPAASVTAAVIGSTITVYRGTTWTIAITGLGEISTYDNVYFSVKEQPDEDADTEAICRVYNSASGLLRFNKAAPVAATNGTVTIDNATTGAITITVNEAETVSAPVTKGSQKYSYDIKGVDSDGAVTMLSIGVEKFVISADVTRAIV